MSSLIYVHGMDSSPQGFRARYLKAHFPDILIPGLPNDVPRRLEILEELVREPRVWIASSLGGLTSLLFVRDHPHLIEALVLIAPAVGFFDPQYDTEENRNLTAELNIPADIPTRVIAGRRDEVIRLDAIKALVVRSKPHANLALEIYDDDHLLHTPTALTSMITAAAAFSGQRALVPNEPILP